VGSKNKLKRFKENQTFTNVIQPDREKIIEENLFLKGKWNLKFFKNKAPIILELGCGKGEYSIYLSKKYPKKNLIGIDIKGARLWRGAKTAVENNINNVAFLRTQIELIDYCFDTNEVDEIWITFPDPQIKHKRSKHRLTNPKMLDIYKKILKENGIVHLKTDSEFFFGYTIGIVSQIGEVIYAHNNIYSNSNAPKEAIAIQTFYEKIFINQNKPIAYMKFRL